VPERARGSRSARYRAERREVLRTPTAVSVPTKEIRKAVKVAEDYDILKLAYERERSRYADLLLENRNLSELQKETQRQVTLRDDVIVGLGAKVRRVKVWAGVATVSAVLMFVIPATWGFLTGYFGG
jgi:hypothetical protein